MREIALLREIQHKNIVGLKDIILDNSKLFLVFEYLDYDLKMHLESLPSDTYLDSLSIKVPLLKSYSIILTSFIEIYVPAF